MTFISNSWRSISADLSSYSSLMTSPRADQSYSTLTCADQSANITSAWSANDRSSIEGISGRDHCAADTHQLLKQMATHNTSYNDMITIYLEIHVHTRGRPSSSSDFYFLLLYWIGINKSFYENVFDIVPN